MTKKTGNIAFRHILFISITAIFFFCLVIIIYNQIHKNPVKQFANQATINTRIRSNTNMWNRHAVDSAIGLLQTGDLVMRNGIDVTSELLRQMNQTNKTYSHCGLVVVENGYPFVYHSIGGEDNPDAKLRRDSASFFFSPYNNFRFGIARYDISNSVKDQMKNIVWDYYKKGVCFDMDFDLKTDDKLYCAEFVYKTMKRATGNDTFITPTKILNYTFVGIDDLFINPHARLIWQVKFK